MKLDLLTIAAHPDDAELTCGGTLIGMAAARLSHRRPRFDARRNGNAGDTGNTPS